MSFSYSEHPDPVSVLSGTHDNSLLTEKVKDCMARFEAANPV